MRFGRTLKNAIYPPWRDQYIDYAKLKKLLREDVESPGPGSGKDTWTDEDEGAFVDELVNVQLEKVHAFHKETYEKLRDRTANCEARLDDVALADVQQNGGTNGEESGNGKKRMPSEDEEQKILNEVLGELDQITKETNELEKYSRINYSGFLKAVKKHDRKRGEGYRLRPLLQVRLADLPFNKEDYSPLLYRLSAMYSFVRQHLNAASPSAEGKLRNLSMNETHPGKEEYISHKFWVHLDNLLEVKTMILRRLPVLVYNPQTSKIAEGNTPDPSITSIYFDNPGFSLYTNKVDHGEASSLRLRWYGQLNAKPEIWVEKKTVDFDQEEGQSRASDSRFTMKEKYVQRFLGGEYHMEKQIKKIEDRAGVESDETKSLKSSVDEIQDFIKENDLQPVLRANYTRTAFQIPGDDRVRISLDTDLAFIREDSIDTDRPCRDPETWHRTDIDNAQLEYPFSSIRKGEITRFPYAVLELKIRGESRKSEWIQDLMNSHLVKEAPRFSKFVHGVAQLFEDYVNTFPFWLSEMAKDIRKDPQQAFEEEQAPKKERSRRRGRRWIAHQKQIEYEPSRAGREEECSSRKRRYLTRWLTSDQGLRVGATLVSKSGPKSLHAENLHHARRTNPNGQRSRRARRRRRRPPHPRHTTASKLRHHIHHYHHHPPNRSQIPHPLLLNLKIRRPQTPHLPPKASPRRRKTSLLDQRHRPHKSRSQSLARKPKNLHKMATRLHPPRNPQSRSLQRRWLRQ